MVRARSDYGFSPRMFMSGLLQYSSTGNLFSSNFRFRWEYRPGSELFVVYNQNANELDPISRRPVWAFQQNLLSVKAQYAFRY